MISPLFSRRLAAKKPAGGGSDKLASPEVTVTLRARIDDNVAMSFGPDSPKLAEMKAKQYFPTTVQRLGELAAKRSLSPAQKLMELRDHPIDVVPHYVTDVERDALAQFTERIVRIGDDNDVPHIIELVDGAVLYQPDGHAIGAPTGAREGTVQPLGIATRPKQATGDGPDKLAGTNSELEYRLVVNILGGDPSKDTGPFEIGLSDIAAIKSLRATLGDGLFS